MFNSLNEVEAKVVKIYEVANTTKESQINGENQMEDFTSSVDYITEKFDEYEEESKLNVCKTMCLFQKTKELKESSRQTDRNNSPEETAV